MSAPKCPICSKTMVKNGRTAAGKQRWKCRRCNITQTYKINSDAKQLESFLEWLLSRDRQCDMASAGRSFRSRNVKFWSIWALPPLIDEIHKVIYVDGFHLGRKVLMPIFKLFSHPLGAISNLVNIINISIVLIFMRLN